MPLSASTCVLATIAAVTFTSVWGYALGGLACLLLLSGIDDLIPLLICLHRRLFKLHQGRASEAHHQDPLPERRIAIFVPCWDESQVIETMVRQNIARIRYRNFDFFLGVYPNDQATCDAACDVASRFASVHVTVCPHAGPTSKADCLNGIYKGMLTFEKTTGARFDTIVLHDAEDVIHAYGLSTINRERVRHEMVQVPVLPLPTSPGDLTHGIYCDEFAEFQLIDMRARQFTNSFVPSNGVGTGFARDMLERIAGPRAGQIFDPSSLTEDYDIGVQIHNAGFRQCFFPVQQVSKGQRVAGLLATREFFPRKLRSAIRQRTRWITGIALQSWERHGWSGSLSTRYWYWRDRKGLFTNPLGLLTNILFFAGLADWLVSMNTGTPWHFAVTNPIIVWLCFATSCLQVVRIGIRSWCVGKLFGPGMGATVALRCFHANFVNCVASLCALRNYAASRMKNRPLTWDKTQHFYPSATSQVSEFGD
jgi:adsorption protein B